MTKLCKDCRWFKDGGLGHFGEFAECRAPQNSIVRKVKTGPLVVGNTITRSTPAWRYDYCSVQRMGNWLGAYLTRSCGPQGRWWTPRQ